MNNEVKTLDGMDMEKLKAATLRVYEKMLKCVSEIRSEEEYRWMVETDKFTHMDAESMLKFSTDREIINYVFLNLGTRFEDSKVVEEVLTEFCESIGLTLEEGYEIYNDVELKGY